MDTFVPTAEELVEEAQQRVAEGYTAMKVFQSISGGQSANETIKNMREKYEKLRSDVGWTSSLASISWVAPLSRSGAVVCRRNQGVPPIFH